MLICVIKNSATVRNNCNVLHDGAAADDDDNDNAQRSVHFTVWRPDSPVNITNRQLGLVDKTRRAQLNSAISVAVAAVAFAIRQRSAWSSSM